MNVSHIRGASTGWSRGVPDGQRNRRTTGTEVDLSGRIVNFDAETWANRGADLTGNANANQGTVSFWLKSGIDGNEGFIFMNDNTVPYFAVNKTLDDAIRIRGTTTADVETLDIKSSGNSIKIASGWVHVVSSWALAAPATYIYLNGVADIVIDTADNAAIDYTRPDWAIGAILNGGTSASRLLGCIAQLYFKPVYIDLSVPANLAMFYNSKNATSTPPGAVDLTISRPFSEAPTAALIYMNNPTAEWFTNLGAGEGFTLSGGALSGCVK
jgi:hypothetical protein